MKKQNLYLTKDQAEEGLTEAKIFLRALEQPEIDPLSLRIAGVLDPMSAESVRYDL